MRTHHYSSLFFFFDTLSGGLSVWTMGLSNALRYNCARLVRSCLLLSLALIPLDWISL